MEGLLGLLPVPRSALGLGSHLGSSEVLGELVADAGIGLTLEAFGLGGKEHRTRSEPAGECGFGAHGSIVGIQRLSQDVVDVRQGNLSQSSHGIGT